GNLPVELEREKLARLSAKIEENVGSRPRIYKAGRYGIGQETATTLKELGYEIDVSVLPGTDLSRQMGPNFSCCPSRPFWIDPSCKLLEIPLSIGYTGLFAVHGRKLHQSLIERRLDTLHVPGILARLGLLERITLTPEGVSFEEQRRLT